MLLCSLQMVDLGNGTVYIEWAMGCQEPGCNGNLLPDGDRSPGGMFLVSANTAGTTESWLASAFDDLTGQWRCWWVGSVCWSFDGGGWD